MKLLFSVSIYISLLLIVINSNCQSQETAKEQKNNSTTTVLPKEVADKISNLRKQVTELSGLRNKEDLEKTAQLRQKVKKISYEGSLTLCDCISDIIGGLTIRSIGTGETREAALNDALKECQKRLPSSRSVENCSP